MSALNFPIGHPYLGPIDMGFEQEDGKLNVYLDTEHLHLQSISEKDREDYSKLFGNSEVMRHYATGVTKTSEETATRVNGWIARWDRGYPFSAFVISEQETDKFIGHIVAGDGDDMHFDNDPTAGYSEMAYLIDDKQWNKGYGKEATAAVVREYVPELARRKYQVMTGIGNDKEELRPLKWLSATTRIDKDAARDLLKLASIKILTGLDFKCFRTGEKFGNERGFFGLDVSKATPA